MRIEDDMVLFEDLVGRFFDDFGELLLLKVHLSELFKEVTVSHLLFDK